jgi:NADH:ubiquinone oxidoreductase subunit 6 (subunit J)
MTLPWDLIFFYTFTAVLVLAALAVISVKFRARGLVLVLILHSAALWLLLQRNFLAQRWSTSAR